MFAGTDFVRRQGLIFNSTVNSIADLTTKVGTTIGLVKWPVLLLTLGRAVCLVATSAASGELHVVVVGGRVATGGATGRFRFCIRHDKELIEEYEATLFKCGATRYLRRNWY